MGKKLSVYNTNNDRGYCEVHFDFKDEYAYIKYYDENNKQFFKEHFPNKSIDHVNSVAKAWIDQMNDLQSERKIL